MISRKAMAIQLIAMDALSPEAKKTGNAYFVTNPTVDGHIVEKNKEDVTISIPAIGVFKALPWFHCDAAAKNLFEVKFIYSPCSFGLLILNIVLQSRTKHWLTQMLLLESKISRLTAWWKALVSFHPRS